MSWLPLSLRAAARLLRRSPRFAALYVAIAMPAVAFTTVVFSLYRAASSQSQPFEEPASLITILGATDERCGSACPDVFGKDAYVAMRDAQPFQAVAGFEALSSGWHTDNRVRPISAARVGSEAFRLLGPVVHAGRAFVSADDEVGAPERAVLSYAMWKRHFERSPRILGTTIELDDARYTIVGVLKPGAEYPQGVDLWINGIGTRSHGSAEQYMAMARLRQTANLAQANEWLRSLSRGLWPDTNAAGERRSLVASALGQEEGSNARSLLRLVGITNLAVLIVLGLSMQLLSLTRTMVRSTTLGLQLALGASRSRVAAGIILEATILALIAGVTGVLAGRLLLTWIEPIIRQHFGMYAPVGLDAFIVSGTLVVIVVTAIVGAIAPLLHVVNSDLAKVLQAGSASLTTGRSTHRLRDVLIGTQLAATFVLMFACGTLIKSYLSVRRLDLGFDTKGLVVATLTHRSSELRAETGRASIARAIVGELRQAGTSVTAWSTKSPSGMVRPGEPFATIEGREISMRTNCRPASCAVPVYMTGVLPAFFSTLGIPIVRGRPFNELDGLGTEPVAIVNERAAAAWWPGEEPIGKRFKVGSSRSSHPWLTVVGVARNSQAPNETSLEWAARFRGVHWPAFYVPLSQFPEEPAGQPSWAGYLLIAARGLSTARGRFEEHPLVQASERAGSSVSVQRVDRFIDLMMDDYTLSRLRTNMFFLSMMAAIALTLSMASVAGMMLENVRQRTKELGIRLALGATPRMLMNAVGWRACRLAIISTLAGIGMVAIGARVISLVFFGSNGLPGLYLFGGKPFDVLVLGLGGSGLIALVALVTWCTVSRIAAIDPVRALRAE